jgi:hypothetical protein
MNQRERLLLILLMTTMLSVGGGLVGFYLVYKPYRDANNRLNKSAEDLANKKKELEAARNRNADLVKANPRLAMWRRLSLPDSPTKEGADKHQEMMQEDYRRWLSDTLTECGFDDPRPNMQRGGGPLIKPDPHPDNNKAPELPGKVPMYGRYVYTIDARADYDGVRRALERLERQPILHSIRKLTLTKATTQNDPDPNRTLLNVKMTVEVLHVTGAQKRGTLWGVRWYTPPAPVVLARPARNYVDMVYMNMWKGVRTIDQRLTEDAVDVMRHVKLTGIWGKPKKGPDPRWWGRQESELEATLYDQAAKLVKASGDSDEMVVKEERLPMAHWVPGSRWWRHGHPDKPTDFTVVDRYDSVVFVGTVVDVTHYGLFFTEKGQGTIYFMRVGDVMYDRENPQHSALHTPLRSYPMVAGGGVLVPRMRTDGVEPTFRVPAPR